MKFVRTHRSCGSGMTLVEVIIVMAISAMIIIAVTTVNRGRGRGEFDTNMRAVVANLQALQQQAASGTGPDPLYKCDTSSPSPGPPGNIIPACPSNIPNVKAVLIGNAAIFAPGAQPTGTLGPVKVVPAPSGTKLSTQYFTYNLYGLFISAYPYGTLVKRSLPANVGFVGACIGSNNPTCSTYNQQIVVMFGKYLNGEESNHISVHGSAVQILTDAHAGDEGVLAPAPASMLLVGANDAYPTSKDIFLNFQDFSGKYHGIITLHSSSNAIDLDLR